MNQSNIKNTKPIIWFTGLPGSGKTTVSKLVYKLLIKKKFKKIKLIDGDIFRKKIKNFRYSHFNRNKVGNLKLKYGKKYNLRGYMVLISGVASNKNWRKKIKISNSNLIEVYIKCPKRILKKRTKKNLYFLNQIPRYEEGNTKDITINTHKQKKFESAKKILRYLISKKIMKKNNY
tara:strand:+ start:5816 stop:6343 length:528 start_codon:yes stop_codon:yes gene_type:complete